MRGPPDTALRTASTVRQGPGAETAPDGQRGARSPERRSRLPQKLPQQTFPEAKALASAIADGPLLRRWDGVEGETALRHVAGDAPLQIKLIGSPLLHRLGRQCTVESLRVQLGCLGLPAVLLLHVIIGVGLERAGHQLYVTATLDELLAAIGERPRSTLERERMRGEVWHWLLLMESMQVIGQRRGRYRDPRTRHVIDLTSRDALIRIVGERLPEGSEFEEVEPPIEVTIALGPWLEQWRGRHDILTYLGEVRRLAAIPAGKPAGAWARAAGLALQQVWRERAARAFTARVGEDKKLTVRIGTVTRRRLLDTFSPSPTVHDILDGKNPQRARAYWDEAIRLLKQEGVIGHYREAAPLEAGRQGWAEAWLDQPLDIRPRADDLQAVAEVAGGARNARRGRRRQRLAESSRSAGAHGAA